MPQSLKATSAPELLKGNDYVTLRDKDEFKEHYLQKKAEGSKVPLVLFQGYIYDISQYIYAHPGGIDRILPFLGRDIESVFKQTGHTAAAYKIMAQLPVVGQIVGAENIQQDKLSPKLREKYEFDVEKGLWWQMWNTDWTHQDYLDYLASPKILLSPWRNIKLFDNPIMEAITQGPWYGIPAVTLPVSYWFMTAAQTSFYETIVTFIVGVAMWTFFENVLHRFLFHGEFYWLPDNKKVIACHFVMNGIHHAYPQDWRRTVFPWALVYVILYPGMILPLQFFLPDYYEDAFISGILVGYCIYECTHYFMHHGQSSFTFLRKLTRQHMHHHYRNPENDFGVTSMLWDKFLGAYTPLPKDKRTSYKWETVSKKSE